MSDRIVLVWQKNSGEAVWHSDGSCSTLIRSTVPDPSIGFVRPRSAGWLPLAAAESLRDARACAAL
jgi:hypothetical protein